jgi:hypothetical protein
LYSCYQYKIPVPTVRDLSLSIDVVAEGLEFPTTMAFLSPDDILALEKEKGTVLHMDLTYLL